MAGGTDERGEGLLQTCGAALAGGYVGQDRCQQIADDMAQGAARQVAWPRRGFLVGTLQHRSSIVELGVDPCKSVGPLRCKYAVAPGCAKSKISNNSVL